MYGLIIYRTVLISVKYPNQLHSSPGMAPPTPVYSRAAILSKQQEILLNPDKYNCQLKSLTQHVCTFKVPQTKGRPMETLCLPFKRIFQRCLVPNVTTENGRKVQKQVWTNIEITDATTNSDMVQDNKIYGKDVTDFLNAEVELKRFMESQVEGEG